MSILILAALSALVQDPPAAHPTCCTAPRHAPVYVAPAPDAATAVRHALEALCAVNPNAVDWMEGGRIDAARAGFADDGGVLVARTPSGRVEVVPARGEHPCRITGDLDYATAFGVAMALLDWAEARGLPWTVRDRSGPVDAWEGPWFRAFTRGPLDIRVEHENRQGQPEPRPDSPSRLIVEWAPPA